MIESQHLAELCSAFFVLKLQVTVQLQKDCTLPEFKGSMLHGWFGHALRAVDEKVYHVLFAQHAGQQPKPYAICPNLDHKTHWKSGELYDFEISLFGDAVNFAEVMISAIRHGERLGFGKARTPFKLLSLFSPTPQGTRVGIHITRLCDWLIQQAERNTFSPATEMAINFQTPVRVKYDGKIVTRPVAAPAFWIKHALRRLTQLSRFWALDNDVLCDEIYRQAMVHIPAESISHLQYEDWQRYSVRQKEFLPFGGLKGQLSIQGEIDYWIPIFKTAEVLRLGTKTTFGLGKIQVVV